MPAVSRRVQELGTTLGGLAVSADGRTVYASGVRNNARGSLSDERTNTFQHMVIAVDVSGPTVREALVRDITRSLPMGVTEAAAQAPTTPERALELRRPVGLAGLVRAGDTLYVLSEASDMLLALDAATLTERARVEVPGRPRALAATPEGRVVAFGHQSLRVTAVQSDGATLMARTSDGLATDPRPEPVAAGMRFFTGTGIRAPVGSGSTNFIGGDTWSCSACHVDGLSDRMIWQAGPVPTHRYTSRGFTMLEGTWPLGWQGYLADVRNYAYTVTTNIGIYRPTQAQVDILAAYLASIQAPPPENSLTERDLVTRAAERLTYRVVAAPSVRVEGRYRVMAEVPAFGPPGTPPPAPSQVDFDLQSTPGGTVTVRAVYPGGIVYRWEGAGLLSGRRLVIPPVPIPLGPATADGFSGFVADVADTTGDGVADEATAGTGEGGRRVYILAGPGFEYPTQGFTLTRMGAAAR